MSRLVIKFPAKGTPDTFKGALSQYLTYLSGRHEVHFIITIDESNEGLNNDSVRQWLETRSRNAHMEWHYKPLSSTVEACNHNLSDIEGDVLLLASEETVPVVMGYDEYIFQVFSRSFPDFSGSVKFRDGLHTKEEASGVVPVIGIPFYKKFGYIFHPEYKEYFYDYEQTLVYKSLNKLVLCDQGITRYSSQSCRPDKSGEAISGNSIYKKDLITFKERMKNNFDIHLFFEL